MAAFFVSRAPAQPAPVQNEIMAILDSVYTNWSAKIGWVQNFIDQPDIARGLVPEQHLLAILASLDAKKCFKRGCRNERFTATSPALEPWTLLMLPLAINKICFESEILAESFKSASGVHFTVFAVAEKIGKKLGLVSRHGYP